MTSCLLPSLNLKECCKPYLLWAVAICPLLTLMWTELESRKDYCTCGPMDIGETRVTLIQRTLQPISSLAHIQAMVKRQNFELNLLSGVGSFRWLHPNSLRIQYTALRVKILSQYCFLISEYHKI